VFVLLIGILFTTSQIPQPEVGTLPQNMLWAGLLGNLLLYVVALRFAGQLEDGLWRGYILLAAIGAWLTVGYALALFMIVVGTLLTIGLGTLQSGLREITWRAALREGIGRISMTVLGLTVAHNLLYALTGYVAPISPDALTRLPALAIAIPAAFATITLAGWWLTQRTWARILREAWQQLITELLIGAVVVVMALVLYEIGPLAFLILIGAALVQVLRYYEINSTRQSLLRRIKEQSHLVRLGQRISTNLHIGGVLENTYNEVRLMLPFTVFFIALRQDQPAHSISTGAAPPTEAISYTFVMQDNRRQRWLHHPWGDELVQRVLRGGQPVLLHEQPDAWAHHEPPAASSLAVPLTVGTETIGVLALLHMHENSAYGETDVALLLSVANQTGLAIRNARLYDRSASMVQNLSLINHSLQEIIFNLDRDQAMQSACQLALQVTQADKAAVFMLDAHDSLKAKLIESIGFEDDRPAPENPYRLDAFDEGPRTFSNIFAIPQHDQARYASVIQPARKHGYAAMMEVPLRSGKMLIGHLAVYHGRPHSYDATEISLMEMIANQITAALNNADLLQALEQYAAEQSQLLHLSRISGSDLDLQRVIYGVCGVLCQILTLQTIAVGLVLKEQATLQLYHYQDSNQDRAEGSTDVFNAPITTLTVQQIPEIARMQGETSTGLFVYHQDDTRLSDALTQFMQHNGAMTLGLLPMRIQNEMIGAVFIYATQTRYFTDNERRLLEMANNQIASQIYNARIHTLTEEALMERLEQLALIEDIAQQVSQSLNLDLIIASVLDAALQATQADIASLALIDEAQQRFQIITQRMQDGQVSGHTVTAALDVGIIGQVIRDGQTLLLDHNNRHPRYITPSNGAYESSLAVPLIKADKVIGVLNVESLKPTFFTGEHISFIKSLAGHAAISIDNAQLLKERQHEITTLKHLRDLTLQSTRASSIEAVFDAVLRTGAKLLQGTHASLYDCDVPAQSAQPILSMMLTSAGHWRKVALALPTDVILQAARTDDIQIMHNTNQPAEIVPPYRSLIAIPIHRRQDTRHVLCVTFSQERHFTEPDQNAIGLLAGQAASHIENAHLNDALRRNNNQMRAILDATRDGVVLLGRNGHLQDANRAANEILGLDLSHYMRRAFADVRAAIDYERLDAGEADSNADATHAGTPRPARQSTEYAILHQDQRRYVEEYRTDVRDSAGQLLGELRTMRDITEQRQLEMYRKEIQRFVMHDLRAPLGSIISSTYMMAELLRELLPGQRTNDDANQSAQDNRASNLSLLITNAQHNAERMLRMVDTMQRQPDDGKARLVIDPTPTDLHNLMERAYDVLAASIKAADLHFEITIDPSLSAVYVDEDIIGRVLTNLLNNAVKFTPGGGRILMAATFSDETDHEACMMVCDTGQGIPAGMRERIFRVSEQVEGNRVLHGLQGFGMGLAFCKLAVETHGGRIWVVDAHKAPLSGACFAFTLPLATPVGTTHAREIAQEVHNTTDHDTR